MATIFSLLGALAIMVLGFLFGSRGKNVGPSMPVNTLGPVVPHPGPQELQKDKQIAINVESGHSRESLEVLLVRAENLRKSLVGKTP